jgi:hypothetical protein
LMLCRPTNPTSSCSGVWSIARPVEVASCESMSGCLPPADALRSTTH